MSEASQRQDSESSSTETSLPRIADEEVKGDTSNMDDTTNDINEERDGVFDIPLCMPFCEEPVYNCDLNAILPPVSSTSGGANLVSLVAEMLRNVEETIRESEANGGNLLNSSVSGQVVPEYQTSTNVPPLLAPEAPSELQLSVKHVPVREQHVGLNDVSKSAEESSQSGGVTHSFNGFPVIEKLTTVESRREALPPEADPFAVREGMTLAWKDVNLTVVSNAMTSV